MGDETAKQFNIAIIGAGIGGAHLSAYLALPEAYKVTMICDMNLERAAQMANGQEGCALVANIEQVFANPDIDIVDICLPPQLHFSVMMAALDAGKHVICEKPFVGSLAETDLAIAKAAAVGKSIFPVFQYRYGQDFRRFKHLQKLGLLGKAYVASLETHWERGSDYYAVDWRGTWSGENGGTIVSHATHIHDLVVQMLGKVVNVSAVLDVRVNPIETEDCAAISMQMQSGALVTSSITMGNVGNMSRLRICFEQVTIESGLAPYAIGVEGWTFTARDAELQQSIDQALDDLSAMEDGFVGLFADIYAVLLGETNANPPNVDDARHSMELITAIYQADRLGQRQALPIDKNHPLYDGWLPSSTK